LPHPVEIMMSTADASTMLGARQAGDHEGSDYRSGLVPGVDWRDDAEPVLQHHRGIEAQIFAVVRTDHLD